MVATGIPPTLVITKEVDNLLQRVIELEIKLNQRNEELQEYLENLQTRLPAAVAQIITDRFQVNGAVPLTRDDLDRSLARIVEQVTGMLDQRIGQSIANVLPNIEDEADRCDNDLDDFQLFPHREGDQVVFRRVPPGFIFPSNNCKAMFDYWNFGDRSLRICPFRQFRQFDVVSKICQKRLIKARRVMTEIEKRAVVNGVWPANQSIRSLGRVNANKVYLNGFDRLIRKIEEGKRARDQGFNELRRENEIQYLTLYNDRKYFEE
jgi:hypothetical protein